MAIEIEKSFVVQAPPDRVWDFLTDPHRVAQCLPGAAITGQEDEHTYTGTMTVKVGPVATSYKGKLKFERLDREQFTAELSARGQDVRGKGGADMRMTSQLVARSSGETEATVRSAVNVTGILAQLGRGMIDDVSDQLFLKFSDAMRAELESATTDAGTSAPTGGEAPPSSASVGGASPRTTPAPAREDVLDVGALGAAATARALGRTVRRPGFWAAVFVIGFLIYWLWLR